jgi:hypothetical protein
MDLAQQLQHLSTTWSPWLDICHFILSTLAVRDEVGLPFTRYNIACLGRGEAQKLIL